MLPVRSNFNVYDAHIKKTTMNLLNAKSNG